MLSYCRIKPAVNEIELNPLCVQDKLVTFLRANDIVPIAYSPIVRGNDHKLPRNQEKTTISDLTQVEEVKALMEKH